MKLWMKITLGVTTFLAGFGAGYFCRKKFSEVRIEEISEEELQQLTAGQTTEEVTAEIAEEAQEAPLDIPEPVPDAKEAYFKRWKDETAQYDTQTKEPPDDIVVTDEEVEGAEDYLKDGLSEVESGSMEDWRHWMSLAPDGEYDPIELIWYEGDDVVVDENGVPLEDSDKFLGFDIQEEFEEEGDEEDIRVVLNHKHHSIFHITRRKGAYSTQKRMEELGSDAYDEDDEDEVDDARSWLYGRQ